MQQRAERFLGVPPSYLSQHPQGGLLMIRALTACFGENEAEGIANEIARKRAGIKH